MQSKKSIGVYGLGLTGITVYEGMLAISNLVIVYDDSEVHRNKFIAKFGKGAVVPLEDEKWTRLDAIIVSPGIPHSHLIFTVAKRFGISIVSDIELFLEKNPSSDVIFITGTNGKSTTTALIGHILSSQRAGYEIGGNIGRAAMSLPMNCKGYVFELSSFQIELLNKINPRISVITNITPDHLDRYSTLQEYIGVKEKILTSESLKIIGVNSEISFETYKKFKKLYGSKIIAVSNKQYVPCGIFCDEDYLYDDYFDGQKYSLDTLPNLQGAHNKENFGISYAVCRAIGIHAVPIMHAIKSFCGLDHRMQYVGEYKNIKFYNDSKATNVSSALSSLSVFKDIVWFAGGHFKEDNLDKLKIVLPNIKRAYLFGESKNLFADFLNCRVEYEICENLEEAFIKAVEYFQIHSDNVVFLLAPACASYDQFKNFEERGKVFCKLVYKFIQDSRL